MWTRQREGAPRGEAKGEANTKGNKIMNRGVESWTEKGDVVIGQIKRSKV